MEREYLWQHPDFPNFYHAEKSTAVIEKDFIDRFKKLHQEAKKSTPELTLEMTFNLEVTETLHSSKIEGVKLDSAKMYDSLIHNTPPKQEEGDVLTMFHIAMNHIDKPLTHTVLKDMNKALLPKLDDSGEYVGDMKIVEGYHRLEIDREPNIVHRGVPKEAVNQAMELFLEEFNSRNPKTPVANAIRSHMHFETIHPFCDGNGRVGRALMVMGICRDMESSLPLAISRSFAKSSSSYYDLFKHRDSESPLDLTKPIRAIAPMLEEAIDETRKIMQVSSLRRETFRARLNQRQEKVMNRLINYELGDGFTGGLSNENYRKICRCTDPKVAQRDLAQLTQKGLLVKTGKLKGTRYFLPTSRESENEAR